MKKSVLLTTGVGVVAGTVLGATLTKVVTKMSADKARKRADENMVDIDLHSVVSDLPDEYKELVNMVNDLCVETIEGDKETAESIELAEEIIETLMHNAETFAYERATGSSDEGMWSDDDDDEDAEFGDPYSFATNRFKEVEDFDDIEEPDESAETITGEQFFMEHSDDDEEEEEDFEEDDEEIGDEYPEADSEYQKAIEEGSMEDGIAETYEFATMIERLSEYKPKSPEDGSLDDVIRKVNQILNAIIAGIQKNASYNVEALNKGYDLALFVNKRLSNDSIDEDACESIIEEVDKVYTYIYELLKDELQATNDGVLHVDEEEYDDDELDSKEDTEDSNTSDAGNNESSEKVETLEDDVLDKALDNLFSEIPSGSVIDKDEWNAISTFRRNLESIKNTDRDIYDEYREQLSIAVQMEDKLAEVLQIADELAKELAGESIEEDAE